MENAGPNITYSGGKNKKKGKKAKTKED